MGKLIKVTLLPLLLVAILALALPAGCSTGKSEDLTQAELEELLADSMLASKEAESFGMRADMEGSIAIIGGSEAGTMDMDMAMEGAIDQASMDMYMVMDVSISADIAGMGEEPQDITMEIYMVDDYMYMKMGIPGMGEEWMKMPADAGMAGFGINDMLEEQLALLKSFVESEYLRDEKVDGADCYVIQMVPDFAAIVDWIAETGMAEMGMADMGSEWDEIQSVIDEVIDEVFEELSCTIWIEKDTKYIKKMTASILGNISSEDLEDISEEFGDISEEFDEISIELSMDMEMYDYNEPVDIVLPAEAQNAMDMGGIGF